jgi:hypothetical protein
MQKGGRRGGGLRLRQWLALLTCAFAASLLGLRYLDRGTGSRVSASARRRRELPAVLEAQHGVCPAARANTEFGGDVVTWGESAHPQGPAKRL